MYDRDELVAMINATLADYAETHGACGAALDALDALGFVTGQIFAQAPDYEVRAIGRQQFTAALQQGLGTEEGQRLH